MSGCSCRRAPGAEHRYGCPSNPSNVKAYLQHAAVVDLAAELDALREADE